VETRRRTRFDERGLIVGERSLPFYGGAMHYWRVDPTRWDACLRAIHALGLTIVETYVPWREHAPAPDVYDWQGARDLRRFLDRARAAGLAVVLRPGPHCNAELTSFGMPDWVLADPECQARTAHGTPAWMPQPPRAFPIPSYASAAFRTRVRAWYAAFADVVAPLVGDPLVALGVDNEAQLFFRTGAFDLDYHADALAWWRDASGLDEPPRAWRADDAARCIEWVRFKERYVARALGDFAAMLDDVGLGELARFHNLPPGHYQGYDLPEIQRAIGGPVGIDAYTPRAQFAELRRRAIACAGNARPLPIAFEVGVGFFPWFPPLDDADDPTRERDQLLSLLACGVRGFNLFMAVARDRYYGAAIDETGKREAHAAWIGALTSALGEVEWPTLRRAAAIALVDTRADARFGVATNVIDPVTPVLADTLGLGPAGGAELGSDAGAIAARRWQTAIARALELAQVPYAIVDEATSEDELARYRAVIAPTIDRIDRGLARTLHALVEHKRGPIVVVGPGTPHHDELGQPLRDALPKRVGRLEVGSLDDVAGLAEDLARLAGDATDAWHVERPDDVRAHAFADPRGRTRVVFVLSDAARATNAVVLADEHAAVLRDPFTRERMRVVAGRATIAMPARGVRMLVVDEA
jgi:beta-galactosidase